MNFSKVSYILVFLIALVGCSQSAMEEDVRSATETAKDILKNGISNGDYVIGQRGYIYEVSLVAKGYVYSLSPSGTVLREIMLRLKTNTRSGIFQEVWLSETLKNNAPRDFLFGARFVQVIRKDDPKHPEVAVLFASSQMMKKVK